MDHISTPPDVGVTDLFLQLQSALGTAYRLERELTGGGMSRLFVANEPALGRQVVVKVLPPDVSGALSAARFKREIELTAHLQHPHILPVLSAGARDGLLYYVMPYIAGESLRHRMTREGQLPTGDACRLLREVADALAFAHGEGVVHRDIKPENILLQGGHALLADFGIAGAMLAAQGLSTEGGGAPLERLTSVGKTVGTPAYMAPEQLVGDREIDGRADIYSLGMVGYEMLAGERPYAGLSGAEGLVARLTQMPPPLHEVRGDVPPELDEAIEIALAQDPNDRFQSAAELHDALEGVPVEVRPTGRVTRRTTARGTRRATERSTPGRRTTGRFARLRQLYVQRRVATRWMAAGVVFAVVSAVAGALYLRYQTQSAIEPNMIAVAPFNVYSPEFTVWHEGLVDVLSRNLDGAGPLRSASPTVVVRKWPERTRFADDISAVELGRQTHAQYVVYGSLTGYGSDSVEIAASVLDVATGRIVNDARDVKRRGPTNRIPVIANALTVELLTRLGQSKAIAASRRTSLSATSFDALKAFLQGEQYYRRSLWDSAVRSYQRAIASDSTFALALRRTGLAMSWQNTVNDSLSNVYLLRAGRANRKLTERDSLLTLADSVRAALAGGAEEAAYHALAKRLFTALETATRRYRDDPEVWFAFGDAHYHFYLAGDHTTNREVLDAFDRAIALDSAFAPAYIHPVDLALDLDGAEAGLRYARKYVSLGPTVEEGRGIALAATLIDPRHARSDEVAAVLDSTPTDVLYKAWIAVHHWRDAGETATRLARAFAQERPRARESASEAAAYHPALVGQLAYRGHLLEAAAGHPSRRLFSELASLGTIPPESAAVAFAGWLASGAREVQYALPRWAERGDTGSLLTALAQAERTARTATPPERAAAVYQAAAAQGYLALARRDTAAAVQRFGALPDTVCLYCYTDRLTKARLLAAHGRAPGVAEAAVLLDERLPVLLTPMEQVFALERGRLAERLNQRDRAASAYQVVVDAWRTPDTVLQGLVSEARAGLARVRKQ